MSYIKYLTIVGLAVLFPLLQSQAQDHDPILAVINGEKITKHEFLDQMNRNNAEGRKMSQKEIEDYLQLFINYKLKLADARAQGFDTLPGYRQELRGYRMQLAEPYLHDAEVTKELVEEAYKHMQEWIQASHILISIAHPAAPADTLAAFEKAMKIYQRLVDGESFEHLVQEYSDDPSAKDQQLPESQGGGTYIGNKGYLGYFSGFDMTYEFEQACFLMEDGEISKPVRTPFGYHIIKLISRQNPLFYRADIAHIWLSRYKHNPADAEELIEKAHQELSSGVPFSQVATKYSDDPQAKRKQGVFANAKPFSLPPQYIEQLLSLEINDYSRPFESSWGWHIIMPKHYYPLPSLANMEQEITQQLSRDKRSFRSQASFAAKVKEEYGYTAYPKSLEEVVLLLNDTAFVNNWKQSDNHTFSKPLCIIGEDTIPQATFLEYMQVKIISSRNQSPIKLSHLLVQEMYEEWEISQIVSYAEQRLEDRYPAFKKSLHDYSEGILIFNVSNAMVWEKSATDSAGLARFYHQHKHEYLWGNRFDATIWTIDNNVMEAATARKIIAKGYKKRWTEAKILDKLIQKAKQKHLDAEKYIRFDWGKFEKGDNAFVDNMHQVGVGEAQNNGTKTTVVVLHNILPPEVKTLDECRGRVISEYQQELETAWIKRIRSNYPVFVYKDVVQSLY